MIGEIMDNIEMINLIKNNCKTAAQEKYIGRLEKKFSIRSKRTLGTLEGLYSSLLVNKQHQLLIDILPYFLTIKFEGNYNHWYSIEHILEDIYFAILAMGGNEALENQIFCHYKTVYDFINKDGSSNKYAIDFEWNNSHQAINKFNDEIRSCEEDKGVLYETSVRSSLVRRVVSIILLCKIKSLEFDDSLLELANEQLEILTNAKYKRYI